MDESGVDISKTICLTPFSHPLENGVIEMKMPAFEIMLDTKVRWK